MFMALTCVGARAQAFGHKGDVSFAADRLMGIYLYKDGPGDRTILGFLAPPGAPVYTNARLGIDGFVTEGLSIGGSFAYWSYDGPSGVLFAPRVGYAFEFSNSFGFWPRGGLTYRNFSAGNNRDEELALTLEGMFYGSPVNHFAFIFGPAFDIGLVGDGPETRNIGLLTAGLLGWL
jgi:hypothetical protein